MDLLRQKAIDTGLSYLELQRETGVLRQTIMRLVEGRKGIRSEAIETLMDYFGLEVVEAKRPRKRPAKGTKKGR
jgi:plasmid maintenance system antidote protein VapI